MKQTALIISKIAWQLNSTEPWIHNTTTYKKKQYQTLDKEELHQTLKDKTLPEPTNKMKGNAALLTENRQQMWRKETRKEETKIPGRRWEQRTVRAFESTDAIACADTDPPCYCTILPTPAALPFASPNTAKPPFCPHTLTLSQTTKLPTRRCPPISSVRWLDLFREEFGMQRTKHKTAPARRRRRRSDSAGLIRVSFLPSFLPCLATIIYLFIYIYFWGGLFLGVIIRSQPFCFVPNFNFWILFWLQIQIWKKESPKFQKKIKKKPL